MSYYTVSKRTIIALALLLLSTLTATNALAQNRRASLVVGEEATQECNVSGKVLLQTRTDNNHGRIKVTFKHNQSEYIVYTNRAGYYEIPLKTRNYDISAEKTMYLRSDTLGFHVNCPQGDPVRVLTTTLRSGDSVDNGIIDLDDLNFITAELGTECHFLVFEPLADVNVDCKINILDLALVGGNFDLSEPTPWQSPLTSPALSLRAESDSE